MQIETLDKRCTGCGACAAACPISCITMTPDKDGFLFPQVSDSCLGCDRCTDACPVIGFRKKAAERPTAYVAYNKCRDERETSSSGGIFVLIAKKIISEGGAVYGAAVCENMEVRHVRACTNDDIKRLQGSKYVQSIVSREIYESVKKDLENGKKVLFSGTPCQIAAVSRAVGQREGFYTASFICHGVPSPKIWADYVADREEKAGARMTSASFRDKSAGWERISMKTGYDNGTFHAATLDKDLYLRAFLRNLCLRESCYECIFKGDGAYIGADILLSDWWSAADGVLPEKLDGRGVSALYTLTEKGSALWDAVSGDCVWAATEFGRASGNNSSYFSSAHRPSARDGFMCECTPATFEESIKKYARTPLKARMRASFIRLAKKMKIYQLLKNLCGK